MKSIVTFINENENELICPYCGKKYKNNNSLKNHERLCKENPNHKESPFNDYNKKIRNREITAWNKGKTKESSEGIRNNIESRKRNIESGKTVLYWTGKHHSEETKKKISKSQRDYLIKNGLNRWSNAHSSERSYPEIFFKEIFKDVCIEQYIIKGLPYKIDFADVNNKIAIEVDGEQHYVDNELCERDKIRDNKINEFGWKVIRIRWSSFQKLSQDERKTHIKEIFNIAGWTTDD